jgi:hypothetical protein
MGVTTYVLARARSREGGFYRSGKSRNWLKTKNPDFVRT